MFFFSFFFFFFSIFFFFFFFFFSSRRRHTRYIGDWSSECALPISRERARLLDRVLGTADVADPDRVPVAVGHDQRVELVRRVEPPEGPQDQLARPLVDPAPRHLEVLDRKSVV